MITHPGSIFQGLHTQAPGSTFAGERHGKGTAQGTIAASLRVGIHVKGAVTTPTAVRADRGHGSSHDLSLKVRVTRFLLIDALGQIRGK